MSRATVTEQQRAEARDTLDRNGGNAAAAARELGIPRSTLWERAGKGATAATPANATGEVTAHSGDALEIVRHFTEPPTEAQLRDQVGADPAEWDLVLFEVKPFDGQARIKDGNGRERIVVTRMHAARARFKRTVPQPVFDAVKALADRTAKQWKRPKIQPPRPHAKPGGDQPSTDHAATGIRALIATLDAHFGKLAWGDECGESYDLRIAERVWCQVFADALDRVRALDLGPLNRITHDLGQDIGHVDNLIGTTTAGTTVDRDGRSQKMVEAIMSSVLWGYDHALETMEDLSPQAPWPLLEIVVTPGNHDRLVAWMIGRIAAAHYRDDPRVRVDLSPDPHKFSIWGKCVTLHSHADKLAIKDGEIASWMARELGETWGECPYRDTVLGHKHHRIDRDVHGVLIRRMRAMCGTDEYHRRAMYSGAPQGGSVLVYDAELGPICDVWVPTR